MYKTIKGKLIVNSTSCKSKSPVEYLEGNSNHTQTVINGTDPESVQISVPATAINGGSIKLGSLSENTQITLEGSGISLSTAGTGGIATYNGSEIATVATVGNLGESIASYFGAYEEHVSNEFFPVTSANPVRMICRTHKTGLRYLEFNVAFIGLEIIPEYHHVIIEGKVNNRNVGLVSEIIPAAGVHQTVQFRTLTTLPESSEISLVITATTDYPGLYITPDFDMSILIR